LKSTKGRRGVLNEAFWLAAGSAPDEEGGNEDEDGYGGDAGDFGVRHGS